ncbi:SAM-dependent methyltransferase [Pedobacter cryoconitis]|uniref:SAM-dependent methyltransferase n=1 Tax=Pedobacter cryoconitis TaxID=188932 RepID=A0A7W8YU51_9SPHI|nr:class I SAM-dependent methyltransferase [Pedobacter cryoconitis]MBB5621839.1 SAM-dependent methyltransferase [Pedobacter cryoconitis]
MNRIEIFKTNIQEQSQAEEMKGFWDSSFIEHQAMWGFEPTNSAVIAKDLFIEQGIKDVLIPGIGYGRNARVFMENDIKVTGIEISPTAIEMAKEYYNSDMEIFQGSVTNMPFDTHLYEGIFCYGLVYLLNPDQRGKMINDSYNQLKPGGWMIFAVVSKNSSNYGKGKEVAKDTFEIGKGGQVFFYDMDTAKQDFEKHGLTDLFEIEEPNKTSTGKSSFKFILIKCKK